MSAHVARIEKLTGLVRSRRNMEKVSAELDNLQELKQQLEPWLEAVEEINSHIQEFTERFDEIDTDYLTDGVQDKAATLVSSLQYFLPEPDSSLATFAEHFDAAHSDLEELETMLEGRDYGTDERDDKWYEVLQSVEKLAEAVAELSTIGNQPVTTEPDDE